MSLGPMVAAGMSGREITRNLVRNRWRENFTLPNYTPAKWWECDVFELTKAGYFREYEIKISRADFFIDADKDQEVRGSGRYEAVDPAVARFPGQQRYVCDREKKHDLLAAGCPRGPVHFWYVTPTGLIQPHELPQWAGHIEVAMRDGRMIEREVVASPRLHGSKLDEKVTMHARSVCYWRMHEALSKVAV